MPELPEVITTVKSLKKIKGVIIKDVFTDTFGIFKNFDYFRENIKNKKILDVFNRGKYIIFKLSEGFFWILHQKLTGHLLLGKWKIENGKIFPLIDGPLKDDPKNLFIRAIFFLDFPLDLGLCDVRKFSKNLIGKEDILKKIKEDIGPDVLSIDFDYFYKCILKKKRIKEILMEQNCFSGIGNIYSDEALWESKINPNTLGISLNEKLAKALFENIKKILKEAIKLKGISISDYRLLDGKIGLYGFYRRVYKMKKCKRCNSEIKVIKIKQRSSYFCPICQIY
jgi:formamidopyrimidine-DNA glycosylase